MKEVLITILTMCILSSCKLNLYDKIDSYIKENCENEDTCRFFLKDITDFDWDKFYIMEVGTFPSEVLGFNYPFWHDLSIHIVFLKEGKIVYHEEIFQDPEKSSKIIFCKAGNRERINDYDYMVFSPNEALFYIKKPEDKTYLLYPVGDIPSK